MLELGHQPSVTLDPPATLPQTTFNLGSGENVLPTGRSAALPIEYKPYAVTDQDDMTLTFRANGQLVTMRIDAQKWGIITSGRQAVLLGRQSVTGNPGGLDVTMPPAGSFGPGTYLNLTAQGQESRFYFTVTNNTGVTQTITELSLKPDLQHRKFTGRVENTRLGWIMLEADRVVKDLALGKDPLTGAAYSSATSGLPAGFRNMLERYAAAGQFGANTTRLWFTPNEMTLKRHVDPATGAATVLFDRSTVRLNTESLLLGGPDDPTARGFVEHFNAHYDAFADIAFPVNDPNDPTGTNIIQVKIFDELREAMKAVSLALFFEDNAIPVDTWWLNSHAAPAVHVVETVPTLTNSLTAANGTTTLTMWGGVAIDRPNTYVPDPVAKAMADKVRAQRPADPNQPADIGAQTWTVDGTTRAVAATFEAQQQDASVVLAAADLSFPSPGGNRLTFARYYDSGYGRDVGLGSGWRLTPVELQFSQESQRDEYRLMRTPEGAEVPVFGPLSDTRLRAGQVRVYDHATGETLEFDSSLRASSTFDGSGNLVVRTAGLNAAGLPTFAPAPARTPAG